MVDGVGVGVVGVEGEVLVARAIAPVGGGDEWSMIV